MASNEGSEKPISEVLKIAFEALKQHEKQIDQVITKLDGEKDELAKGAEKLSTSLEEILQKLSALEQEVKILKNILQT
jgi:uncharacterized protein YaaN involved in tellurite resistance